MKLAVLCPFAITLAQVSYQTVSFLIFLIEYYIVNILYASLVSICFRLRSSFILSLSENNSPITDLNKMASDKVECSVNFNSGSNVIMSEEFSDEFQKSFHNLISREGYISCRVNVKKISTEGNNFLGELYDIGVNGKTCQGDKETNIFLKRIIYNDEFRIYSIPEVYKKESFVYTELGKIFQELQESANIPPEDRFKMVKSYEETNGEVIVLENLTKKGFKTYPRMEVMSVEFARLSIEQLAKFHGLSFVLQNKKPEYFETNIKTIKQSMVYDDYWNDFVKKMCDVSTLKMDVLIKKKIAKFFEISLDKYPKYMNGQHSEIKCLCHGDYKMNNVLFKENESLITEVIAIDYQQIYYGCPIIDLIYFIYAASDRDFRKQHLVYLKDVYYDSLTSFLNYFGVDVATVCPKMEFEACFKNSLDYALMYTLYMLPMFFVSDDVPDLSKDELLEMRINVDARFYDRMQEIVDEFIELQVL